MPGAEQVRRGRMATNRVRTDPLSGERRHFDLRLADIPFDQSVDAKAWYGMTATIEEHTNAKICQARSAEHQPVSEKKRTAAG